MYDGKRGVVGEEEEGEPGAEMVGKGSVRQSFKIFPLRFRALFVMLKLEAG